MDRECFNKHVNILGTGIFGALHDLGLVNEVFDRLVFEIASHVVVKLVNIDDFDRNDVSGGQMVTGIRLTKYEHTILDNKHWLTPCKLDRKHLFQLAPQMSIEGHRSLSDDTSQ